MGLLALLVVLPLGIVLLQLGLDLEGKWGVLGYSLYKTGFLVPPILYCRAHGIRVGRDILKFGNGRRRLGAALAWGGTAILVFWGVFWLLDDILLDKQRIATGIHDQFSVTPATVFFIAPVTICANSLLEEFFYRGFGHGLLYPRSRMLATLLPAAAYTAQHMLFIHHWFSLVPNLICAAGLFIFSLVLQVMYRRADSIVAPWIAHACGDIAMIGVAVNLMGMA